ncbi:MAG TPA: MFS transporter [Cyclobacteriaceae bacterium]|nr:MFS transporter [Cyclobacteriaceae bacterium]
MNTGIESATPNVGTGGISAYLWVLFGICFLSNVLGGTVSTLMSVYLPVVVRDLLGNVTDDRLNQVSAYINALYILGWAFGGFSWGVISDKIGRNKSLVFSIGGYGLFTFLLTQTYTWEMVVLLRMITGFCVGGVLVITATFLSEVWPEKTRAIFLGVLSIGFPVGIFSAGAVNYFVSAWRQGFSIGIIPIFLALITILFIRESEKWATSKPESSSKGTISQASRENGRNLTKGSLVFGFMIIGLWAIFSWLPTWIQSLLKEGGQTERGISMMLLGGVGLTGGFFSGWISNQFGTRKAMMWCFAGCFLLSCVLFGLATSFSKLIYIGIAMLALCFGVSQGLLSVYIPQLFAPTIRATATGFCFNIGRLLTAAAVFFVGALVTTLGGYGHAILAFSIVFLLGWITLRFSNDKK